MSRSAFLFPGRGAQAVGMGQELAEAFASAREVFQVASNVDPGVLMPVIVLVFTVVSPALRALAVPPLPVPWPGPPPPPLRERLNGKPLLVVAVPPPPPVVASAPPLCASFFTLSRQPTSQVPMPRSKQR